eukprot:CAMPEP_0198206420 /NCGR_PEP_ID=MMETSP1445-20131203/9963_1 /TAXON_ID=36898 /ORGANISM="Pyramimonas sp., Strain CCMP2087" /LENGTH=357 /DNA_ID=CAMNT_0043879105 /DNA_START=109 /DNA_END=1179 /DNA_ORIENTATION=-
MLALLKSESVHVRGLLVVLCACATLTTVALETRIIDNLATGDEDFLAALLDSTVHEVVLKIGVTLPYSESHKHGVVIRRYLTVRGEMCNGLERGLCAININGTSALRKRGFFVTDASHLTMRNVHVYGGLPEDHPDYSSNGAAFYIEKSSCVTCVNCDISNNNAGAGWGGAIFLTVTASFNCENCKIRQNTAQKGGAMYFQRCAYCSAHLKNTTFTSNRAEPDGDGGAMAVFGKSVIEFDACIFDRNQAAYGGVLYTSKAVIYLKDTIWKPNFALSTVPNAGSAGPLLFIQDASAVYIKDWSVTNPTVTSASGVEVTNPMVTTASGLEIPLMVKQGQVNEVTTEYARNLVNVELLYC